MIIMDTEIKKLGADCVNQAIDTMNDRGQRFSWRSIEAVELFIGRINALDVSVYSKEIKQEIFSAFLPPFTMKAQIMEDQFYGSSNTEQGTLCPITEN